MPRKCITHHYACDCREAEFVALKERLRQLEAFAAEIMDEWWTGDLDGGSRQDIALKHGVLTETIVTESCGENCWCAEYDDFPQSCYRIAKTNFEVSDV